MAEKTTIEWAHATFNPWWGCTKVSPACLHCYAAPLAKRRGYDVWGKDGPRRFFGDAKWAEPLRWDASAKRAGERRRVFCASMADVFEDRVDLDAARARLWDLISRTPNLDWLLLTKRPEMVLAMVPWRDPWPTNVWVGTTVEDQRRADERLPHLAAIPATVRFISAEPLLGPIHLGRLAPAVDFVIAGGESGHSARPSNPRWFTHLLFQCLEADVAFHFKQWGEWGPVPPRAAPRPSARELTREVDGTTMYRVGKKLAGRMLLGEIHDGLPVPSSGRTLEMPLSSAISGSMDELLVEWPENAVRYRCPPGP